jgi:hypothetical protein
LKVSSRPNALLLFNPVLRFDGVPELMSRVGNDERAGKLLSPTLHLAKDTPPALLFYGTDDRLLKRGQEYVQRSKEVGHRAELYLAAIQAEGVMPQVLLLGASGGMGRRIAALWQSHGSK